MNYIGSCETTFKARFNNHTHSFRNRNKSNATELSKYYWNCIIYNNKPDIKWNIYTSAHSYECGSGRCNLCREQKKSRSLSRIKKQPSINDQKFYPNVDIKINSNCAISKVRKPNFHF